MTTTTNVTGPWQPPKCPDCKWRLAVSPAVACWTAHCRNLDCPVTIVRVNRDGMLVPSRLATAKRYDPAYAPT